MNDTRSELLGYSRLWRQLAPKLDLERLSATQMILTGQCADIAEYKYWSGKLAMLNDVFALAEEAAREAYSTKEQV